MRWFIIVKSYNKKCVISGDVIEIYEYENSIVEGYKDNRKTVRGRSSSASEEDKIINRNKTYTRARTNVRRLINSNINSDSKFVTLTFKDNVTNIQQANYEFKKFRQRLESKISYKLQYVAVVEFQKRGAIHYHVVMFNLKYISNKLLREIWGQGYIKINKIKNCDNVGAYVCKYMTKDSCFDERLQGQKMYFSSRNLKKPIEIKESKKVDNLGNCLPEFETYNNIFENDYNKITYKQYNLKRCKSKCYKI